MKASNFRRIASAPFPRRSPRVWLGLLLGLSSPALAQPPAVATPSSAFPVEAVEAGQNHRDCLRQTATRIKRLTSENCPDLQGRSYDRRDINRTGAVDVSGALRRMDPSVTIRERGGNR